MSAHKQVEERATLSLTPAFTPESLGQSVKSPKPGPTGQRCAVKPGCFLCSFGNFPGDADVESGTETTVSKVSGQVSHTGSRHQGFLPLPRAPDSVCAHAHVYAYAHALHRKGEKAFPGLGRPSSPGQGLPCLGEKLKSPARGVPGAATAPRPPGQEYRFSPGWAEARQPPPQSSGWEI